MEERPSPGALNSVVEFGSAQRMSPADSSPSCASEIAAVDMNELSQTVCINSNLYGVTDAGCKVDFKKSLSGQGSPVAVTHMEEVIHPGTIPQVEFRFKIENRNTL